MDFAAFDPLAVVVAGSVGFAVGGLWYAPFAFGHVWLRHTTVKAEDLQANVALGPTLAALAASGRTPRDVVAAWKPAWERLRNAAYVWEVRNFTLPWAGWCLRAGDTATAKEALTMFDDEDATPPAWAFAAAMPPLSEWSDPAAPADVAAFLLGRIRTEDASRRSDLIRLAMVLVRRFEAAGRAAEGEALRRDLKSVADGVRLGTFTP